MNWQFNLPKQSPVEQAAPLPLTPLRLLGPVPSSLNEQLVRPHILPCQFGLTHISLLLMVSRAKPPVPGPMPFCVPMPGHIVSGQLLVTMSGMGVSGVLSAVMFVHSLAWLGVAEVSRSTINKLLESVLARAHFRVCFISNEEWFGVSPAAGFVPG